MKLPAFVLSKKLYRRGLSVILAALMTVSLAPDVMISAGAVSNYYYKTSSAGSEISASSFSAAWNYANNYTNGVVGIKANTSCDTVTVAKGKNITLELNGHVLNRGKTTGSAAKDANVISVSEGSTLSVYGGTKSSPQSSTANTVTVWSRNSSNKAATTSRTLYGGVITGGYNTHNGGGINVEKNAALNLYYTNVSGNRSADSGTTVGGYGGGIALRGDYAKVYMEKSYVSYNYVEEAGGGICFWNSNYCSVKMKDSYIQYNSAEKQHGGGAATYCWGTGESCKNNKIEGNGSRESYNGSRIAYNYAGGRGGGVYIKDGNPNNVIKGLYINSNQSKDGAGIYLNAEKTNVKNCNIVYNIASNKGGGIYNGDDFNTVSDTKIMSNSATSNGGGIYNEGTVDITLSGKCTVKSNTGANATDNLYMAYNGIQDDYYLKDSLSTGSEIGVRMQSGHPNRLTFFPGTYHESYYTYDNDSSHYFKWYSYNSDTEKNRHLYLTSGTKPVKDTALTFSPDSGKRTKKVTTMTVASKSYDVLKGVIEFPATANDKGDKEGAFYYSDGYFMGGTSYNNHLATMSANLAMAAMYSNVGNDSEPYEYRDKSNNFRQLMSDIGCKDEDIYVNDFNVKRPTTSSIGVGISSKKIGDDTLVIIGVRGAGYEAEWASNVSIDGSGEAGGFSYAAYQVFSELNKYLKKKSIDSSKAKFWISGYSRAGATSNLVAKRIVDNYDKNGARTFAYPIEAPKGGLRSEEKSGYNYNCIHNVLNTNDIVPWVAPGEMGFVRYGVDHFVPGNDSSSGSYTPFSSYVDQKSDNNYYSVSTSSTSSYYIQKQKMLKQLNSLNDDIVYDDYFHAASINYVTGAAFSRFDFQFISESDDHSYTPENFIPDFFKKFQAWGFDFNENSTSNRASSNPSITNGSRIRNNYATTQIMSSATSSKGSSFQEAVALLCGIVFTMPSEQKEQLMNVTDGLVDRIGISKILSIYTKYINKNLSAFSGDASFYDDCETIWKALTELSTEDEAKGYHSLKEYMDEDELDEIHTALPALLYPLLTYIGYDYKYESQDQAGTLAYNAGRLIQNHYPEVAVSWIRSYDSYYTNSSYGDDTKPITIGSSARNTPKKIAAEVKSASEGTTTTTDGSDSSSTTVTVRSLDEVRLVPNNESDKNTGEAIYYRLPNARYSFDRVWHGFSEPFVFGNMDNYYYADGGSGNTYTVEAIATHYDKNTSGVKVNPSNLDGTKRTFVFNVENYGVVAYPTSYSGTFPSGSYSYNTARVNSGDTYTTLSGVKPDNTNTWKFVKWTVYPYKNGAKDGDAVSESLFSTYFGGTFDSTKENTEVTNLTNKDFLFEPSYVKQIGSVNFNFSNEELPSTVSIPELNASNIKVVWSYDNENNKNEFTCEFDVPLPEGTEMAQTITQSSNRGGAQDKIIYNRFSYTPGTDKVHFAIVYKGNDSELQQAHSINVIPIDRNVNQQVTDKNQNPVSFTYNAASAGTGIDIAAPEIENKTFIGWRYSVNGTPVGNINTELTESNTKNLYFPNGNSYTVVTLITAPVINVNKEEGLTFYPYYIPIVSEVDLVLDKNVRAGQAMPVLQQVKVNVGSEWEITSNKICEWSPDVVSVADCDTTYTARYKIAKTNITGSDLAPGSPYQNINLEGMFVFADDVTVNISDGTNNINVVQTTFGEDDTYYYMDVVFNKTTKAKIESFENSYTINAAYKTSASGISDKLPDSVSAVLSDNSIENIPIEWNSIPSFTDNLAGQTLNVTGQIKTDYELKSGLNKNVSATINILPAPSVQNVEASPVSGEYDGSTVLTLSSESGAKIYYTYTTSYTTEEINGENVKKPDFGETPSYTEYTSPINISDLSGFEAGKEIFVRAYAQKTDMNNSAYADFTYKVNALTVESVASKNAKIIEDGVKSNCYRLRKADAEEGDESLKAYRYFSDSNGFNELDSDDVIDSAFVKARHTVNESLDTGYGYFGFTNKSEYKGLDLLGVQKRETGEEGGGTSDLRFVTAVDSRILKNATDYGYVITKINENKETYKVRNKADVLTIENGKKYSCRGESNNLSGDYGNMVYDKGNSGYTDYKYVTARITGINPEATNYVLLARFYVVCEDGTTVTYATYNTNYDGCAANYYKLDHPDVEPAAPQENDPEPVSGNP